MEQITAEILHWASERGLLDKKNILKQLAKLGEEYGEVCEAINKRKSSFDIASEIGDMYVVLTILAAQHNVHMHNCVEIAYQKIANRTGETIDGMFVKSEDIKKPH